MTTNVLLVGESWVSAATHYKGFDHFGSVTFHLGAEPLQTPPVERSRGPRIRCGVSHSRPPAL